MPPACLEPAKSHVPAASQLQEADYNVKPRLPPLSRLAAALRAFTACQELPSRRARQVGPPTTPEPEVQLSCSVRQGEQADIGNFSGCAQRSQLAWLEGCHDKGQWAASPGWCRCRPVSGNMRKRLGKLWALSQNHLPGDLRKCSGSPPLGSATELDLLS